MKYGAVRKFFRFCRILTFPATRGPFSFVFAELTDGDGRDEKGPLPWVETPFDSTAVHGRGRRFPKRMLPVLFADLDLSPLYLAHSLQLFRCHLVRPHK